MPIYPRALQKREGLNTLLLIFLILETLRLQIRLSGNGSYTCGWGYKENIR